MITTSALFLATATAATAASAMMTIMPASAMIITSALFLATATATTATSAMMTIMPASSNGVKWVGRTSVDEATGQVLFDWEGVSASVVVSNFTYVVVNITDNCMGNNIGGGSRWSVTMTTSNPNVATPNHRISTFWTGSLQQLYYMFNNPGQSCDPNCAFTGNTTFTLTRLTESRLSGCTAENGLGVSWFGTDGSFGAPPPPAARKLVFVGDSISAGDLNDNEGATVCGNAAYNDDITYSTGGQLCLPESQLGFGPIDCHFIAWGGIQLPGSPTGWGMRQLFPYTFSSDGPNAYLNWTFSLFPADGVVINLGTNDRPAAPALEWQQFYVGFVTDLVQTYFQNPNLEIFLAYGPMTAEYQPFVTNITATLVSQGVKANLLDLTLPHPMRGCYGHPSYADNVEIAAKAKPQIGAVMGWN